VWGSAAQSPGGRSAILPSNLRAIPGRAPGLTSARRQGWASWPRGPGRDPDLDEELWVADGGGRLGARTEGGRHGEATLDDRRQLDEVVLSEGSDTLSDGDDVDEHDRVGGILFEPADDSPFALVVQMPREE